MPLRPLTPIEARVLGTLMEKARTVPDSYPLTLNTLTLGCNQKTSRDPLMALAESQVQDALERLGHEVAGTIREIGEGVAGFAPGDRVVLNGVEEFAAGWAASACPARAGA